MQGGLAAVGCALGLAAAWQLHDVHTAIGAVLLGLPIPVTLLFIGPINAQLLGSACRPKRGANIGAPGALESPALDSHGSGWQRISAADGPRDRVRSRR